MLNEFLQHTAYFEQAQRSAIQEDPLCYENGNILRGHNIPQKYCYVLVLETYKSYLMRFFKRDTMHICSSRGCKSAGSRSLRFEKPLHFGFEAMVFQIQTASESINYIFCFL